LLFPWFDKKGVKHYMGVKFGNITGQTMYITTRDGHNITLEADTFVTALPLDANNDLINKITGKAKEVYFIGDAKEPKLIAEAVAAGAIIANSI
jgi:pyruvate/2-oxoglutarate dehydrogenase complex dihydrolipoamide dehydrogenase (E3) component